MPDSLIFQRALGVQGTTSLESWRWLQSVKGKVEIEVHLSTKLLKKNDKCIFSFYQNSENAETDIFCQKQFSREVTILSINLTSPD